MEPNTRDTPMRRCNAYFWGTVLILSAGVVGLLLYPIMSQEGPDLVDQEQEFGNLFPALKEVHEKQAKTFESYDYKPEVAAETLLKKVTK